jgi:hypothetical protein
MGSIASVTERHAYRGRNRNRRVVVAECTPDSSGDGSYGLSAPDVGLSSIESVALETPVIRSGSTVVTWDDDNEQFNAYDTADGAANTTDLSSTEIVAVVTGTDE